MEERDQSPDISKKWNFPPVLTAMLIFQENGFSKKQFWKYIREPETIPNPRPSVDNRDHQGRHHILTVGQRIAV